MNDRLPGLLDPARRHHFVGIGGVGMSALARVLLARGFRVSGSDARPSAMLDTLAALGADVAVGHRAEAVRPGDVVIATDAARPDNAEIVAAHALALHVYRRSDLLGAVANTHRTLAVSGTHGKTTTSGMLSLALVSAGLDPTCILGGELAPLGGNARVGGDLCVVEACEAYNSFLDLRPAAAIVTNLEADHLDFHGTPERLFASFRTFLGQVRELALICGDDARLVAMDDAAPRTLTYGFGPRCDYRADDVALGPEPSFTLLRRGEALGTVSLCVPGAHNVSDALGAAALALEVGAPFAGVAAGLRAFPGMLRRFERIGACGGVAIVDDYAHHPTEIAATLRAARDVYRGRLVALFQPHLFSRTRDLLADFASALAEADVVLLAPIYAAREDPIPGISHHLLGERIRALAPGLPCIALETRDDALHLLRAACAGGSPSGVPPLAEGDAILTVGAGDIDSVAHALVSG